MRRGVLLAFALALGCGKRADPPPHPGYERVHARALSAYERERARSFDGKAIEVLALVRARPELMAVRHELPLFRIVDGKQRAERAAPEKGYLLARLRGRYRAERFRDGGPGVQISIPAELALDGLDVVERPLQKATLRDVAARPRAFDGAHVVIEGHYENWFEVSALEKDVWLSGDCGQTRAEREGWGGRVRAQGWLFTRERGFGHGSQYRYLLLVDQCTPLAVGLLPAR
jgi:hypothetical protein